MNEEAPSLGHVGRRAGLRDELRDVVLGQIRRVFERVGWETGGLERRRAEGSC